MLRIARPVWLATAAYLLLTVVVTWPLVLSAGSVVPNDLGDPLLNIWIMAWNARAVPLTEYWWNAPQFFPVEGALAFSEHLLGQAPITTPIILLTDNAVLAYNATFFLSFVFSALGGYFLGYSVSRRHDVAFVCGLAFGFAPYRVVQLAHVQVLSSYWMPVALGALHRYLDDESRRRGWLALFAVAWVMQALSCGYYFFYLAVLIALWLVWFAFSRRHVGDVVRIGAVWVAGTLVLAPVMYGYWRILNRYNFKRPVDEITGYSADMAGLLTAGSKSYFWGWLHTVNRAESELFPGVTVVVLTIVGLVVAWRKAAIVAGGASLFTRAAVVTGFVFLGVTLARVVYGPFKLAIGGVSVFTVTAVHKPLSVAALMFGIVALLHPSVRAAWRLRSPLAFYSLAAVVMYLLSLGPAPTSFGQTVLYKAPYAWLMMLPGFDGVRVPARFWMLAVLCLSVSAALAVRVMSDRRPRLRPLLLSIACVGILIDGWPSAMTLPQRPGPRPVHSEAQTVLNMPPGSTDTIPLYWSIAHQRPLWNGYSGFFPRHYDAMMTLLSGRDRDVLFVMARYGSIEAVVDHHRDRDGRWRAYMSSLDGVRQIFSDEHYTSYVVPAQPMPKREPDAGKTLEVQAITVSTYPELVGTMTDGDFISRWHAGRGQQPGDWMMVDFGTPREVRGAELYIGGYSADYPRELTVETSTDGDNWEGAWQGRGALAAFIGALERPVQAPVRIDFEPRTARYVRFTQTGSDPVMYWSVAELRMIGR